MIGFSQKLAEIRHRIQKGNELLAARCTQLFGTMGMFYLFIAYSTLPMFDPGHSDKYLLYSNAVQLVALPLLMVGSIVLGRDAEKRAQQDHQTLLENHQAMLDEMAELRTLHQETHQLVTLLAAEKDTSNIS